MEADGSCGLFLSLVSNEAADFFVVAILVLPAAAACFGDCFRVALLVAGDFDDAGGVFEGDLLDLLLLIDGMYFLGFYESLFCLAAAATY